MFVEIKRRGEESYSDFSKKGLQYSEMAWNTKSKYIIIVEGFW